VKGRGGEGEERKDRMKGREGRGLSCTGPPPSHISGYATDITKLTINSKYSYIKNEHLV